MPLPRTSGKDDPMPVVRHEDCWAKTTEAGRPGISVEQHCRTAGAVANLLVAQCPDWLREALRARYGVILAALHDVGKVSPGFQSKCASWCKRHGFAASAFVGMETDHAKISQKTIQDMLEKDGLKWWAAIVGAHHGKLKGDRLRPLCDGGNEWDAERRRLANALIKEFGPLPDQVISCNDVKLWFNAGLIAVADWLASDEHFFPPSTALSVVEIHERARKQLDRVGFRPMECLSGKTFADLFPFSPNELQATLMEAAGKPGVYVVEAAMGCGKTEAALVAAYNLLSAGQALGIYFALPTQVTSNRIHKRVQAFIERICPGSGTRLTHGNSWLLDTEQAVTASRNGDQAQERIGRDWFASSRRALLAPFGVGTVDQALLGVVAAKHFFVRQFGLVGKVVILDEVHSYDLYTGTLVSELVTRLRDLGATVIILSATLTAARRRELLGDSGAGSKGGAAEYPLLSVSISGRIEKYPVQSDPPKTVQVRFMAGATLPESVLTHAERGECVLWIRNTVSEAQDTYKELCGRNKIGGPAIALLHSRFPQYRRDELEDDWLDRLGKDHTKRPSSGCVLVSTQVAEQSVDIDADLLVTDLAPTDMLLQRLGRLWRHPRQRPEGCDMPEAWISRPELDCEGLQEAGAPEIKAAFGKSAKVYAPYVLLRTFLLWQGRTQVTVSADIRPMLEATYADAPPDEPDVWQQLRADLESRRELLKRKAIANSNPWQVPLADDEGVQTRWNNNPTASVLIVRDDSEWDSKSGARLELLNGEKCELKPEDFNFNSAKAMHRNIVKVPKWCVRDRIGSTPGWLREYFRGDILVCKLDGESLVVIPSHDESGLKYRDDLGVIIPPWRGRFGRLPPQNSEEQDDESYD